MGAAWPVHPNLRCSLGLNQVHEVRKPDRRQSMPYSVSQSLTNLSSGQDNYCIVLFDKCDCLKRPLKSHLIPSDDGMVWFLQLHFEHCLSISTFGGDVRADYEEGEINQFMDELVYLMRMELIQVIQVGTPLGHEVHVWLLCCLLLDVGVTRFI